MWDYIPGSGFKQGSEVVWFVNQSESEEYATDDSICGNYFTTITEWDDTTAYYKIAYAKDTKVKYLIIVSGYKFGITPLYNADGTLQVYEE